jgi:hypothetical protein
MFNVVCYEFAAGNSFAAKIWKEIIFSIKGRLYEQKFGMSFTVCVWFFIIVKFCNYNFRIFACIMASYIKEEGQCDVVCEVKGSHNNVAAASHILVC